MYNKQAEVVYQRVVAGFQTLGASDPVSFTRHLLLRERLYVGQRFQCEEFQAVVDGDAIELRFYAPDGKLLKTVPLAEPPMKKAA